MPIRAMSKYLSKAGKTRLVLTTKRARKGFYKGKGSTKEGHLTSKGRFIVNHRRRLQLILPDLTGFKVSCRVSVVASSPNFFTYLFLSLHVAIESFVF